jgi:hypothetical protein
MEALGSGPPDGSPEQLRLAASLTTADHALGAEYHDAITRGAAMDEDELVDYIRTALHKALRDQPTQPSIASPNHV